VAFPIREHTPLPEALIRDVVLMKLELVGLRGAHRLMPEELSGGMARRVALARAIALDPLMILYDEPFVGLDPISMGVIVRLIRRLNDALGLTSVIVTHDVHEVTAIADVCYLLSEGKVMGAGSPRSLAESDSEWVRQFMNGLDDGPVPFPLSGARLRPGPSGRCGLMAQRPISLTVLSDMLAGLGRSTLFLLRILGGCLLCCCVRAW